MTQGSEQDPRGHGAAGAVLVIGGGMTGLHAAVALENAGVETILLEQGPILGGKRAARLAGEGDLNDRLSQVGKAESMEILTLSDLLKLSGEGGDFTATIAQRPRFVTTDCTRCNHCVPVCPQVVPNEYDAGLTFRKAIHSPLPETIPNIYSIDLDTCLNVPPNYLPCQRCVEVCDDQAIHFDMQVPEPLERHIAAVIVATGYADNDAAERAVLEEFGYGTHPDIVSSVELQRLLEDPGPSGGFAIKPSNESYPDRILLVMTRVSASAAWVMCNQLKRLAAQNIEQLTVLVLAPQGSAPELQTLVDTAASIGATMHWGNWVSIEEAEDQQLRVRYAELPAGRYLEPCVDLLVLSSEVHAEAATDSLAEKLELERNEQGYLSATRPGIYIAGGAQGTVGIEEGADQAQLAVEAALLHITTSTTKTAGAATEGGGELPRELLQQQLERMLYGLIKLGE